MAYRVRLEGSPEEQVFRFKNYDDAFNFASMAVDAGTYQDCHFERDEKGESIKIWDDPVKIEVRVREVE